MSFSYQIAVDRLEELKASAPFLSYSARLATFKTFALNWKVNSNCTPIMAARAGWYSTATRASPNSVMCPFCQLHLEFDSTDDPWQEHNRRMPECDFVKLNKLDEIMWTLRDAVVLAIRCATIEKCAEIETIIQQFDDSEDSSEKKDDQPFSREEATKELLKLRDASHYLTYAHRLESFTRDIFGNKKGTKCTSKKLAEAGWYSTATDDSPTSAKCSFCLLELEFEETDDPWNEHQKRAPDCDFVKLGKLDETDWSQDEAIQLAVRCAIMKRYETSLWLVEEMVELKKHKEVAEKMKMLLAKKRRTRQSV